jgi:hypothetical protein
MRTAENRLRKPRRSPRELEIRPPHLDDERLAERRSDRTRAEPVRVHEIRIASRTRSRTTEVREKQRQRCKAQRPSAHVADDPRAVRKSVVAKARRRDDIHVDGPLTQSGNGAGDEDARDVVIRARVRRGEDADAQGQRAETSGSSASLLVISS